MDTTHMRRYIQDRIAEVAAGESDADLALSKIDGFLDALYLAGIITEGERLSLYARASDQLVPDIA